MDAYLEEYMNNKYGECNYMFMGPENPDPSEPLPVIVYLGGSGEYKAGQYGTVGYYDSNKNGTI